MKQSGNFKNENLYGDDFSIDQINKWYKEEAEGYADLVCVDDESKNSYPYHTINTVHGFSKLERVSYENVLGFGSSLGFEFEPILNKINKLTIVEPSDQLISKQIGNLFPVYVKPEISGVLKFENDSFDLITCFGTLHHIPNVSFVVKELIRVLKPNGMLLVREPINSMGDFNVPRNGLTKNERGIPVSFFENLFKDESVEIVSKVYCFTMTSFIQRTIGRLFKKAIYSYKSYVIFDKFVSALLKNNVRYHSNKKINKIAPSSIFIVIKKNSLNFQKK